MQRWVCIACLLVGCGNADLAESCPSSESLLTWATSQGAMVAFSECNRTAEVLTPATEATVISRSYWSTASTVSLSASFELLSGAGRFDVLAGKEIGPIVNRKDSGTLTVTGEVVGGFAGLAIHGVADAGAAMRWRVSQVSIRSTQ